MSHFENTASHSTRHWTARVYFDVVSSVRFSPLETSISCSRHSQIFLSSETSFFLGAQNASEGGLGGSSIPRNWERRSTFLFYAVLKSLFGSFDFHFRLFVCISLFFFMSMLSKSLMSVWLLLIAVWAFYRRKIKNNRAF